MRKDTIPLEESRVGNEVLADAYPPFKERHRVFPAVFEGRKHQKVLDLAAGVGYVSQRLLENYPAKVICHDISPGCLSSLHKLGAPTLSFDIDNMDIGFPFSSESFDAIISLVTIEHVLFVDEFIQESHRILHPNGYFYISTPNYAAPEYLIQPLVFGRTYHNPLSPSSRYEFYAHVRYFTYRTLVELIVSKGFVLDTVYIALPGGSERYQELYSRSKPLALAFKNVMSFRHHLLPPGWATEPILCFQKTDAQTKRRPRKVIL